MDRGVGRAEESGKTKDTILVVDDSQSVQTLSRNVLEVLGYAVVGVVTGGAALRWLETHEASLVLLDYRLPDMTGLDLLRQLAARGRKLPFVAITAYGDEKVAVEMMKLGALDYLAKDQVFADLLPTVVRQVLGQLQNERRLAAAEQAARESEGRFQSIFENAAAGMATVSPEGRILQANPALCRFLGYGAGELPATDVCAISHPDDREATRRLYRELAARQRSAFSYEKRYLRRDGSTVWGQTTVAGVYDGDGRLGYSVALLQDISGRKRYEELTANIDRGIAIKTGEDFFRFLVDWLAEALGADLVFVGELPPGCSDHIRTVAIAEAGGAGRNFDYPLAGAPCANVVGRKICIYPAGVSRDFPEDRALAERGIEGYAAAPLFGADEAPLGLLVALFRRPIADAGMVESLLQVFSIRAAAELERSRSEMRLRQKEQKHKRLSEEFQALLDGIPDLLLLLTPERKVIWANRAALQRLEGQAPAADERYCRHFCANGQSSCDACPVSSGFEKGEVEDSILKHADGTRWGVKTFPLHGASGKVDRLIMLASDITEKVRLREEAERSGRLAAVGELAAGVAHEINNPTGLILMNLPVIMEACNDAFPILDEHFRLQGDFAFAGLRYSRLKGELPYMLKEIHDGAERIKQIVDDLKGFARGGREEVFGNVDLNAAVLKSTRLVGNAIRNATDRFVFRPDRALPPVYGNAQRLEQVVVNLLINACQALPDKDRRLEVATVYDPQERLCKLLVVDEGVGIAEAHLPHLTDPFFTTRRQSGGTGLGLSVSARIVREHRGRLTFESAVGKGTTVTLSIPAVAEEGE